MWSKRNIEHVERLRLAGLMTEFGETEVARAQADGRWFAAYDAPSQMTIPDYFLKALAQHPQAEAFFNTLNKTNMYAIGWRLQTAKTDETRTRRMDKIIAQLATGQKIV